MTNITTPENILIIGSGGRENALAWRISKTKGIQEVFVAPGNGGTELFQRCKRLDIEENSTTKLINACQALNIGLVIIGPEAPLAAGLADNLRATGLPVFGPCSRGAQLEASKSWAKALMKDNKIPTAQYWSPRSEQEALAIVDKFNKPLVVKADGLAAGKGVTVSETIEQTKQAVKEIFDGKFSTQDVKLILEEKLDGPEVSIFALCDGKDLVTLPPAQDHKRLLDNDLGPNTGGMGAYVPAPLITQKQLNEIKNQILYPTLKGLQRKGINYIGVIYAGLMITKEGPKVIEFNCRFGDPECQALMPLMGDEFIQILYSCALGELKSAPLLSIQKGCSACIVLAADGYPESPRKGDEVTINIKTEPSIQIFHAGTKINQDQKTISCGGRVLCVVAQSENFDKAFNLAYKGINEINFKGMFYRKDIGYQVRNLNI